MDYNTELISYCGLYCGNCYKFKKKKCLGCRHDPKLTWCKIKTCNIKEGYHNCSDCQITPYRECKLNHNIISKFFALVFKSDREACLNLIKKEGKENFADKMNKLGCHTIKRSKK